MVVKKEVVKRRSEIWTFVKKESKIRSRKKVVEVKTLRPVEDSRSIGFESRYCILDGCHDFAPNMTRIILNTPKINARTLKPFFRGVLANGLLTHSSDGIRRKKI